MARIIRKAVGEFAQRPISNSFIAFGGFLLTRSVSGYLDKLETHKRREDERRHFAMQINNVVELDQGNGESIPEEQVVEETHA